MRSAVLTVLVAGVGVADPAGAGELLVAAPEQPYVVAPAAHDTLHDGTIATSLDMLAGLRVVLSDDGPGDIIGDTPPAAAETPTLPPEFGRGTDGAPLGDVDGTVFPFEE